MKVQQIADLRDSYLSKATQAGEVVEASPFLHGDAGGRAINQFCLFLKPELTALPQTSFGNVLELIRERLDHFDVHCQGNVVIPGQVLDRSGMMRAHYGVIDEVARRGTVVFSEEARKNLSEFLDSSDLSEETPILGAFQFLESFEYFSPAALAVMYDNLNSIRLAGGTHAALANVRGNRVIILNGFHPDQLLRYTSEGASIVVFQCSSRTNWTTLRRSLTGATNPEQAEVGSIRQRLLVQKEDLGIPEFNSGQNGVHLSAGPVEGMVELARYFTYGKQIVELSQTHFGALALEADLGSNRLKAAAENADLLVEGRIVPAFDLTEEVDTRAAIELLERAVID